jgi:hypothetical protein
MGKINMCEENEKCEDNKGCGNDSDNGEEKVNDFVQNFLDHGLGCGSKIADIAKEMHPDALIVVPLYRSCIVIDQSDEEKKEGVCTLHTYADPHWLGGEIDLDTLKSDDFHFEFCIRGDRQGPAIVNKKHGENVEDQHDEDEYPRVIEHDEN